MSADAPADAPADRPNVWLILCDQLRADVLGCYGHPFAQTPQIDALAADGTVFDRAYTPSPVCVPARACLLTGREPQHNECFENGWSMPDVPTFADELSAAGYRTHAVGKMHFTPDPLAGRGFQTRDISEELADASHDDYLQYVVEAGLAEVERPLGLRDEMYYVPQLSPVPQRAHHSHWVADRSIEFVDRHADRGSDDPFLLVSSFIAPHPPFTPPAPWHRLYDPSSMPDPTVPNGSDSLLTAHQRLQNRYKNRDAGSDRRLGQLITAYYLASVSFVDAQIGRIRAVLEATGRLDDTVIMLTSDHGEFLGDYGCYGKRSFLDAAARIPLVCAGPGFPAGRSGTPVGLLDVAPSLRAAAGIEDAADRAETLQSVAAHPDAERRLFGQYQQGELGMYAVIESRWTYVWSALDRRELLLDRLHDPAQTRNVAHQVRHRAVLERLRAVSVDHFADLAGQDLDRLSGNRPLRLGMPVEQGGRDGYDALDLDADAAQLVVGVGGPDPDETWRRYRAALAD